MHKPTLVRADGGEPGELEPAALQLEETFEFSNLPTISAASTTVDVRFLFKANETRDIVLRLLNAAGEQQGADINYTALRGYGHKQLSVPLPTGMAAGDVFTLEGDIRPLGTADTDRIELGRLLLNVGGNTTANRYNRTEQVRIFPFPQSGYG